MAFRGCTPPLVVCYSMGMSENKTTKTHRRPVAVASTVLVGGIIVSLWFNLKAISLEPNAEAGAYVSGILWPLGLLLAIELLIHTPWRKGATDTLIKVAVLVLVAGVAAWISYWHGAHVLAHWSYDTVGQHVGPLVPDAAMALATLALQRVGQARRLATEDVAMATPVATPLTVANVLEAKDQATLANWMAEVTDGQPATAEPTLEDDWASLERDFDEELAAMTEAAKSAPEPTAPPAQDETTPEPVAPAVQLTTVPAEAAKRITEALAENPKAAATALAADLVAAGLASSDRTGRRYVAAIKNNTARVS